MKIRMITTMAGPTVSRSEGHVYDVPDDEGATLVAAGIASEIKASPSAPEEAGEEAMEPVATESTAETTDSPPAPEEATAPPQRKNPARGNTRR